ncbi:hypothetical protein [Marinomonas algicola]|uniref:hypothetical protein n=1 Tax=Marinomonas algicola TaxID=2773454 RepID=UPI00174DCDA9|nr:hypothetical protein [Marinomonas algicola]
MKLFIEVLTMGVLQKIVMKLFIEVLTMGVLQKIAVEVYGCLAKNLFLTMGVLQKTSWMSC